MVLTRTSTESALRSWGLKLRERIGFKRAAVAVARKLAVIMHAMLKSSQPFQRHHAAAHADREDDTAPSTRRPASTRKVLQCDMRLDDSLGPLRPYAGASALRGSGRSCLV